MPRHIFTHEERQKGGKTRWEQLKHGPDHGHYLWLKRLLRGKYKRLGTLKPNAKL